MKILVIRRDNIGDLVCTTPLIRALRRQLPTANIQALVTHYNAAVLAGNTDLDEVHSYQKAKHRGAAEGRFAIYWDRLKTVLYLRRQHFDWVLLPGGNQASALRFARMVAPQCTLVRDDQDRVAGPHEVEQGCHLLHRMGLVYETPAPLAIPNTFLAENLARRVRSELGISPKKLIGVHISARKISQRWPAERFTAFIAEMTRSSDIACLLFWAPGSADDPKHPGDDAKASNVINALRGKAVVAVPTHELEELIAGISLCDQFLCADGGAMHLAAALGKSMVCLFGDSDPSRWGPWGVPHQMLQAASRNVQDIPLEDVLAASSSWGFSPESHND